jgi:hypothetical protein
MWRSIFLRLPFKRRPNVFAPRHNFAAEWYPSLAWSMHFHFVSVITGTLSFYSFVKEPNNIQLDCYSAQQLLRSDCTLDTYVDHFCALPLLFVILKRGKYAAMLAFGLLVLVCAMYLLVVSRWLKNLRQRCSSDPSTKHFCYTIIDQQSNCNNLAKAEKGMLSVHPSGSPLSPLLNKNRATRCFAPDYPVVFHAVG